MFLLHNNHNSDYIIINFKINQIENINFDLINKYYTVINNWVQQILDNYNYNINWKFYTYNINFKIIRVFITIDNRIYAKVDPNTHTIYISNFSINNNKNNIDLLQLINNINEKEFEILFKLNTNGSKEFYENDSNDSNDSLFIEDTEFLINNIISNIGISGVTKETFISELKKIPLLKFSHYNSKFSSEDIFNDDIYEKVFENNIYKWISTNNNSILYTNSNINHNKFLFKFINEI